MPTIPLMLAILIMPAIPVWQQRLTMQRILAIQHCNHCNNTSIPAMQNTTGAAMQSKVINIAIHMIIVLAVTRGQK